MKRKVILEGLCASLAVVCALGIVVTQTRTGNQENASGLNEVNEYHTYDGEKADIVVNYGGIENRQIDGNVEDVTVIDSDCTLHTYSPERVEIKETSGSAQWEGKTDYEPKEFGRE